MTNSTATLAAHVAALRYEDLPPDVVTVAKQCVLDLVGVTVAGAREPAPSVLSDVLRGSAPAGTSPLIGGNGFASLLDAALINGTAGHALDYDDVSVPMVGHPTVPVLPAVFAHAVSRELTGAQFLTALVAGLEAEIRLARALGSDHYARGFHTTSTTGAVGAAAGSAHALGLDAAATATALGIGATQASGIKASFGSDAKPLNAGRAAAAGALAALLAEAGFTASADALGSPQGMLAAFSDATDTTELERAFGPHWEVPDLLFKYHAACYLTHSSIDASLALRDAVSVDDIERIVVDIPTGHLDVCAIADARTGLEGKFSLAYVCARALVSGKVGMSEFTDDAVADPAVRALAARVELRPDTGRARFTSTVSIFSGATETSRSFDVSRRRWTSRPEEQWEPLRVKFLDLVTPALGESAGYGLYDAIVALESAENLEAVAALVSAARSQ
ncbi:MmgE/PrpD family protein [Microbacterium sp. RD1]|uniref:MmgE/PrpD family protein n=1 Tax=Microbacterium sp. RD1 TaxID=3457313 RepID=UPI003FA53C76